MSREECVFPNRNNANLLYFITKVHLIIILDIFHILEKMYFEVLLTLNSDWSNYVSVCNKAQVSTDHADPSNWSYRFSTVRGSLIKPVSNLMVFMIIDAQIQARMALIPHSDFQWAFNTLLLLVDITSFQQIYSQKIISNGHILIIRIYLQGRIPQMWVEFCVGVVEILVKVLIHKIRHLVLPEVDLKYLIPLVLNGKTFQQIIA